MKRLAVILSASAFSIVLAGCASQSIVTREWYAPDEKTMLKREDGQVVGALKSETVKSGQPDWSTKSISVISIGK